MTVVVPAGGVISILTWLGGPSLGVNKVPEVRPVRRSVTVSQVGSDTFAHELNPIQVMVMTISAIRLTI